MFMEEEKEKEVPYKINIGHCPEQTFYASPERLEQAKENIITLLRLQDLWNFQMAD